MALNVQALPNPSLGVALCRRTRRDKAKGFQRRAEGPQPATRLLSDCAAQERLITPVDSTLSTVKA